MNCPPAQQIFQSQNDVTVVLHTADRRPLVNRMPGLERDMREFIVENLTNTEALSVTVILMNNVIALIVAFFIMFTYKNFLCRACIQQKI